MIGLASHKGELPDLAGYQDCKIDGAGAIILTQDGQIILQRRSDDAPTAPGVLCGFGGGLEAKETYLACLQRELYEELHAKVDDTPLLLGVAQFLEDKPELLAAIYFWRDVNGTIDGCYEGKPERYATVQDVLQEPKLEFATAWALQECVRRGLIPA